jgi:hypothetical protein
MRVRRSPTGTVAVEATSNVWVELRLMPKAPCDELHYLDADEVAEWPEYVPPSS